MFDKQSTSLSKSGKWEKVEMLIFKLTFVLIASLYHSYSLYATEKMSLLFLLFSILNTVSFQFKMTQFLKSELSVPFSVHFQLFACSSGALFAVFVCFLS